MIQAAIPWQSMPLHHRNLAEEVIRIYVDWLNAMCKTDIDREVMPPYTPANFLDKETNQHADLRVNALLEDYPGRLYAELIPFDGDDGGPATLYVHAERRSRQEPTDRIIKGYWEEHYEITGYNTEPDGTNTVVELNPPKRNYYEHPETRTVYEDYYDISLIIQEFDTYYSVVYNASDPPGG